MKTILLIEDDKQIREGLEFALREEGYGVIYEEDGPSGLKTAREACPDLILLDVMLPEMSGIDVCKALKYEDQYKSIPILMMTALGDMDNTVKGLSAGANDYVSKPFNLMELLARVKSHLMMKELYDIVKNTEEEKSALLDVSQSLSSTIDPRETLFTIVSKISEVMEVKRCSIIYIDPLNRKGYVMASHDSKDIHHMEINIDKYPEIAKIMETGEPVIINDVYNDPILFAVRDILNMIDIRSIMAFPVIFKSALIGTLILRTSRREAPFNKREIQFCRVITNLSASPLKNAYLFEMLHKEKEKEREGRLAAEEKSRLSRELLETIKEASPIPICVFDPKGKVTDINSAYLNQIAFGTSASDIVGKDIMTGPGDAPLKEFYGKILGGEKPGMKIDTPPDKKEGKKTHIFQGAPLYDVGGELIGGMFTVSDITEIRKSEELIKAHNETLIVLNTELERARLKSEEANRLKTEFLANMSHELRTPLTSIIGFSKIILQRHLILDEAKEFLDIICEQGDKLLEIINDILDLSKIEMGTIGFSFASVDVNQVLMESTDMNQVHIIKKNQRLIMELDDRIPLLRLDKEKLIRVFSNIIDNASKFTSNEGEITLATRKKNDSVEVAVRDTGIGIKKEDRDVIFDRFRQLDGSTTRQHEGLGLGLDLVKKLVEGMKGTIRVESEPGKGSSFIISFPKELAERIG